MERFVDLLAAPSLQNPESFAPGWGLEFEQTALLNRSPPGVQNPTLECQNT